MSIEQMMKDGKTDIVLFYKDGELWYRNAAGFEYPYPGQHKNQNDATYLALEKSMHFMR